MLNKTNQKARIISLGEGQTDNAETALQEPDLENILILHNLHLSEKVGAKVSKFIEQLQSNKPHKEFKLIIITKPTLHLSKSACEKCLKLFM